MTEAHTDDRNYAVHVAAEDPRVKHLVSSIVTDESGSYALMEQFETEFGDVVAEIDQGFGGVPLRPSHVFRRTQEYLRNDAAQRVLDREKLQDSAQATA